MISKQQQKYIQSLHIKKNRAIENAFLVEGRKSILELEGSDFDIQNIYTIAEHESEFKEKFDANLVNIVSADEINKLSSLATNKTAVAVVSMKSTSPKIEEKGLVLILDSISDPGNLGTIIRIADWYGINQIICSDNTVDFYNPKVIVSSMGSFVRVRAIYTDISHYLNNTNLLIYGAYLDGENVHECKFPENACLVIGSESHGISEELIGLINNKITIPRYGAAESLNAGIATAIIIDNIKRYQSLIN